MKKLKYIFQLLALGSLFVLPSCDKESENLSRITYYPVFDYKGDHFVSVPVGGTYTDPGVTATLDGKDYPVTVEGAADVDFNTPGVYTITYSSINPDTFPAYEYRYIGVIAPDAVAADLSGNYERSSNGAPVRVTKIADGLYLDDNVGGLTLIQANLPYVVEAYFFHVSDSTIITPNQLTSLGFLECVEGQTTATGFQWVVINGNFGASTRKFSKL
jgi:hypothetical protein